jgi:ElaB/YqjD/DUF883 family membrane-anchored ribosome-binding protein
MCCLGPWSPRKIKNEGYFEDPNPFASIAPIQGIAVEVWTTTAAILFDNFVLSHSADAVQALTQETIVKKGRAERAVAKQQELQEEKAKRRNRIDNGDLMASLQARAEEAAVFLKQNPWIGFNTGIAFVLGMIYILIFKTPNEETIGVSAVGSRGTKPAAPVQSTPSIAAPTNSRDNTDIN